MKNHSQLLEEIFNKASTCDAVVIPGDIKDNLSVIASNAQKQKGVFTVLLTLCIHKIYNPKQDIRKHQSHIKNGFSARRVDTQYITPVLKKLALPAMAESGWLTRSLEHPHPYNLKYPGKIKNTNLKSAFLKTVDYVQKHPGKATECSIFLIYMVKNKFLINKKNVNKIKNAEILDIEQIIIFLNKYFYYKYNTHGGAKIPVIAFHSIFKILVKELKMYKNCELKPLGSHTASDKTARTAGDIEILSRSQLLYEAIEIKFNKSIDSHLLRIIKDKIYTYNPKRYCVFSTNPIKNKNKLFRIVSEIRKMHGCQVILNGVLPTLRYYLRLISDKKIFLNQFLNSIANDCELQLIHKNTIDKMRKKYF